MFGMKEKTMQKTIESLLNSGHVHFRNKEWVEAIEAYAEAIRLKPDYATAIKKLATVYHTRGLEYYNNGDYDKALADYNRAIEVYPNDPGTWFNRGIIYSLLNYYRLKPVGFMTAESRCRG
jgi:tetratricopeptide (TPR) repeat protein